MLNSFVFLVVEKSRPKRNRATTRPSSSDDQGSPGTVQSICTTIPRWPRYVSTRLWQHQARTENGNRMSIVLTLLIKQNILFRHSNLLENKFFSHHCIFSVQMACLSWNLNAEQFKRSPTKIKIFSREIFFSTNIIHWSKQLLILLDAEWPQFV